MAPNPKMRTTPLGYCCGKAFLASRTPYLSWMLLSSVLLAVACFIDPYVFAFTAYGTAWLSGGIVLAALIAARSRLLWAITSVIPTAISFALLSTYKWA